MWNDSNKSLSDLVTQQQETHSVLGPPLQEGHRGAQACPEKGNETGEGSG